MLGGQRFAGPYSAPGHRIATGFGRVAGRSARSAAARFATIGDEHRRRRLGTRARRSRRGERRVAVDQPRQRLPVEPPRVVQQSVARFAA